MCGSLLKRCCDQRKRGALITGKSSFNTLGEWLPPTNNIQRPWGKQPTALSLLPLSCQHRQQRARGCVQELVLLYNYSLKGYRRISVVLRFLLSRVSGMTHEVFKVLPGHLVHCAADVFIILERKIVILKKTAVRSAKNTWFFCHNRVFNLTYCNGQLPLVLVCNNSCNQTNMESF